MGVVDDPVPAGEGAAREGMGGVGVPSAGLAKIRSASAMMMGPTSSVMVGCRA